MKSQVKYTMRNLILKFVTTVCFLFLLKLGEYNLLLSILTLRFINRVNFNFGKSYVSSDSHTNSIISESFAYPSR